MVKQVEERTSKAACFVRVLPQKRETTSPGQLPVRAARLTRFPTWPILRVSRREVNNRKMKDRQPIEKEELTPAGNYEREVCRSARLVFNQVGKNLVVPQVR